MSQSDDQRRSEPNTYGQGGQQRGPVRSVDVPDLDLRAEHLQDARGELFGDQDDGQARGHKGTA